MSARTQDAGAAFGGSPAERQRLLLGLLAALGGPVKDADFQLLLFLFCQRPESGRAFEFVPGPGGPCSLTALADRRKCLARGLLEDRDGDWALTPFGVTQVRQAPELTLFVEQTGGLRGDALLAEVARRHPYFAIRSDWARQIIQGDPAALARIDSEKPTPAAERLLTIGYEGQTLEGYLNSLIRAGVTVVCDVRRNPLSHKFGFSKRTLGEACGAVGIRYEHFPELGIAAQFRKNLHTPEEYAVLFDQYEQNWLPLQSQSLETILAWIAQGEHVALTCFEHLPDHCHRLRIVHALGRMTKAHLAVRHL